MHEESFRAQRAWHAQQESKLCQRMTIKRDIWASLACTADGLMQS